MNNNTKQRYIEIRQEAVKLLSDVESKPSSWRILAHILAARADCNYYTAKKHLDAAWKGEDSQWGGVRPNSGRPKKEQTSEV